MTGPGDADALDVVVFVGSTWSRLAQRTTRWRELCVRLAARPEVARLTVVDYLRFSTRRATTVDDADSWLAGVRCLDVNVRADRRYVIGLERSSWDTAARLLEQQLGSATNPRLVLCANPLATPLALRLAAASRGFDAYDDWRAVAHLAPARRRVDRGYRQLTRFDTRSAVSTGLATRLADDYGARATVVRNGVDAARFAAGGPAPSGLPTTPFAVYVGTVERRVDVDLLAACTAAMHVVVAGDMDDALRSQLTRHGVTCLGAIPADQVPGLLHAAAVGLVPHRVDALTTTMDPLKVLEYRAAGLPVVATEVPGTDIDGVDVPTSRDEWPVAVRNAAARGKTPPPSGLRDWSVVVDELLAVHRAAADREGPDGGQ